MTGAINKLCEYITKTFIDNKICIERKGKRGVREYKNWRTLYACTLCDF